MLRYLNYLFTHPQRWQRWIKDIILDIKYGHKFLGGDIANENVVDGWSPSTSSDYEALSLIFSKIVFKPDDILVDIGCGRGRVFNWLLKSGITNELIGIEVDKEIAEFTRKRLRNYSQVKIMTGNVCDGIIPPQGTIFYLFNPFLLKS